MRGLESNTEVKEVMASEVKSQDDITITSASEVHWTMPTDKRTVTMTQYNKYGREITSYTITNYITMTPGDTYVIKAT